MTSISLNTPLSFLTVGDFMELLNGAEKQATKVELHDEKKYVYGILGIRKLFSVSHATACRYKETVIKDAVMQNGRKIIVDSDKALELFNAKNSIK